MQRLQTKIENDGDWSALPYPRQCHCPPRTWSGEGDDTTTAVRLMLLRRKTFVGVIPGRMRSTRAQHPYPHVRSRSGATRSAVGLIGNALVCLWQGPPAAAGYLRTSSAWWTSTILTGWCSGSLLADFALDVRERPLAG